MMDTGRRECRALLVDDDAHVRGAFRRILVEAGWAVSEEDRGAEVVATARRVRPDLILLDLMMPQIDGYTVLLRLQREAELRDIPVFLVSGEAREVHADIGRNLGAAGFLEKPVDETQLLDVLKRLEEEVGSDAQV